MSSSRPQALSLAEVGALALHEAAEALDRADSAQAFLKALERNRRIWQGLGRLPESRAREVADPELVAYALRITDPAVGPAGHDDHIQALIEINLQVSARLAGGDIEPLRQRALILHGEAADDASGPTRWPSITFDDWAD